MKYKGVKTLEVLEGANNYNKWISARIREHLLSPVLEIGAGTGNITTHNLHIEELVVTDIDDTLVKKLSKKFHNKKNIKVELLDIGSTFGKISNKFNTIYSVNVLEHIENDLSALKNMHKLLKKSGKVVLLVPAKKSAYTAIDKQLGHFRRYEKDELGDKLRKAGFTDINIEYFNILGLISWFVRDKIDRGNAHLRPSHVKTFDWIVPILMKVEPRRGLPAGISLIAVATKR